MPHWCALDWKHPASSGFIAMCPRISSKFNQIIPDPNSELRLILSIGLFGNIFKKSVNDGRCFLAVRDDSHCLCKDSVRCKEPVAVSCLCVIP